MSFPPAPAGVTRWTFHDGTSSVTFEINPDTGGTPTLEHNIPTQNRIFPGELTTIKMIADNAQEIDFSGTIISEEMYNLVITWFNKTDPIILTDDLGRSFTIIIETFDPKRVRQSLTPWYHTYSVTALVVG